MISLCMGIVSEMVKIVATSTVLKIVERFSDAGAEMLSAIAGQLVGGGTTIS